MATEIENWKLYSLMLVMLIFGAANTVIQKVQNEMTTYNSEKQEKMKYYHPWFQTFGMAFAEFGSLGVYYIFQWRENKKYGGFDRIPDIIDARRKGLKTSINIFLIAIPSVFDITGSFLMFLALTLIAASIYQMLRGGQLFIVAIMSVLFLKRKLYRHHWTSLSLILGGLTIVGATPLIYPNKNEKKDDGSDKIYLVVLGICLVVVAQIFSAGQVIAEEKLFQNYYLNPLKVVGFEGFWGVCIVSVVLACFQYIKCSNNDIGPHGTLEDTPSVFKEWKENDGLWITTIFYIISVAGFNGLGVTVTKYASSAQRSTIDSSRTAAIWLFFIFYQGPGHEKFIWLELVGFGLLILGAFIFNEVLVLPFFGFNKYTKAALRNTLIAIKEEKQKRPMLDIDTSIDEGEDLSKHRKNKIMYCLSHN